MKNSTSLICFFLGSLLVLALCLKSNPNRFLFTYDYYRMISKPPIGASTQYKELTSDCVATAQYRENVHRTGADLMAYPAAALKVEKRISPLNVDIHEASKSSPIIDETGVYIGSDAGWLFKMDFNGNLIWKFYVPGSNNGIHGSVAVDSKKVYIGAYNGFMYALDKSDGSLVWANPVAQFIGASPLLAGGALYISAETGHPDGLLAKLDCNSGETLWVSKWLGGHSHSSPAYDEATKQVVVGANSGRFYAFDANSGKVNWEQQLGGPIKGTPMIWDGTVYFSSWDKNYHAYDLLSGVERWKTFMGGRIQTSLTHVPESEIGVTNTKVGDIIGINLSDGEILWRLKHGDSNHMFSILVTKDPKSDKYLAWSRCKIYQLCTLDAKTGQLLHHIDLPGSFTSVPAAWKERLYISLDNNQGLIILNE